MKLTYIEKDINNGEEFFFFYYDDIYCMMVIEVFYLCSFRIVKKIKVNYFRSSANQEPFTSLLVNVEKDELFRSYEMSKLNIKSSASSYYSIISICNFRSKIRDG